MGSHNAYAHHADAVKGIKCCVSVMPNGLRGTQLCYHDSSPGERLHLSSYLRLANALVLELLQMHALQSRSSSGCYCSESVLKSVLIVQVEGLPFRPASRQDQTVPHCCS